MNPPLEYPIFLLLIPLGVAAVFRFVRQKSSVGYNSTVLFKGIWTGFSLLHLERFFLAAFIAIAALILARPTRLVKNAVPVYRDARDVTLVLDISGSMSGDGIKTAEEVISKFVEQRPQDRFALVVFNDYAVLEWPLSLDHEEVIFRLSQATPEGGTQIATGIIAGLGHQQKFGQNPGAVIVVSDGGSLVTEDEKTAIEAALGQTKFYWIWIKEKGKDDIVAEEFATYVTSISGKIFMGGLEDLGEIFSEINRLEASPVLYEQLVVSSYNFGLLPLLALANLLLAGLINQLREV